MNNFAAKKAGILFIGFLLLSRSSCREDNRQLEKMSFENDSLSQELAQQKDIIDSLRKKIKNDKNPELSRVYFGSEFEDIENPEEFITSELKDRPEEIPLDPVLGGTMEFRRIVLLSEEWIYAEYDDGHIMGSAIYRYTLHPKGSLTFELVTSRQAGH